MSQEPIAKTSEEYDLRLRNGLLSIEGGLSMSGVSIDMVKNLREVFMCLSTLVGSLEGKEILKEDSEIGVEWAKSNSLLKYLRKTRAPLISGATNQSKGKS
jgi:hypothetical protein